MKELLLVYAVISLIAFVLYGADKWKAKRRSWRIRESVLLTLSFLGGAVGGSLGMMLFRHKTKHWYFVAVNFLGLVWQAVAAYVVYRYCGMSFFG